MHLHELTVYKNGDILRSIRFKKGLNLIINSVSSQAKSGNSVGKSTPSRLLDYIFLSSGEDIYTDSEFRKVIPEVYDFIQTFSVLIELSFTGLDNKFYSIGRILTTIPKNSTFYVDGHSVDKTTYSNLVSRQIFGQSTEKPSIRTLSHKFIRNTNEKMQNTTRFLHGVAKSDTYDQLYLFLFGFGDLILLRDKATLNNQISTKLKHLAAYRVPYRESALQKMIKPLKVEENELEEKIGNFALRKAKKLVFKNWWKYRGRYPT